MVKPPLRTKSIGFKVSEEEYAQLETAAQTSGQTLGAWCREVILRGGSASDSASHDPALAAELSKPDSTPKPRTRRSLDRAPGPKCRPRRQGS
jgi:hypothetical protein